MSLPTKSLGSTPDQGHSARESLGLMDEQLVHIQVAILFAQAEDYEDYNDSDRTPHQRGA